jgi:hypothetical protein
MRSTQNLKTNFSKILDNVIISARDKMSPLANSKKEMVIGDLIVAKKDKVYCVLDKDSREILYDDLYLVEAALLLAKYHQLKNHERIKTVLQLESSYTSQYTDMTYFLHSYEHAKNKGDYDKMSIQQSRYENARLYAKDVKFKIRRMYDGLSRK